ncbi:MAG: membrane protein insertase YidC [Thermoanaerobaculia bacterium]
MEKRIFAAIIVSIALLWGWAAIAPKLFPELARKPEPARVAKTDSAPATTPTGTQTPAAVAEGSPAPVPASNAAPVTPISADRVQQSVVEGPGFVARFSNRGAQMVSFQLKSYKRKRSDQPVELVKGRDPLRTDFPFSIVSADAALANRLNSALWSVTESGEGSKKTLEYRYAGADGVSATKTFRFTGRAYLFDFSVSVNSPAKYRLAIGPGIRTLGAEEHDNKVLITGNGVVQADGDFSLVNREKGDRVQTFDGIEYIGIEDNYFLSILRPTRGGEGVINRVAFFDQAKKRRDDLYASVNATTDGVVAGEAFFGPKEAKLLDGYNLGEALQFGWFGVIARFLLTALVWINQYTLNFGWAIVVLTIVIKIVLYPLQHKSIVSMKKMQKVQPKVEAIKNKFKKSKTDPDQRQKMNVEMMQLYQKEGINPMAGCLPILLQLPVLWGFYGLLSRAIELRGAPFALWIHDLSDKDPYYITPILMTITMFIQTWITPTTADPAQRKIFLAMPVIFGFFFKDFPSGLVLYWLVQNVLTIIQQMIMNKWWKGHPEELQKA